jgi:hypothetical protein
MPHRERCDGRGIQPAGQEAADRNIRDQAARDGLVQQGAELLDPAMFDAGGALRGWFRAVLPLTFDLRDMRLQVNDQ